MEIEIKFHLLKVDIKTVFNHVISNSYLKYNIKDDIAKQKFLTSPIN